MKTPKVIYLQTCGDCAGLDCATCDFDDLAEVSWCKDKINDSDAVYFSEDAVRKILSDHLKELTLKNVKITGIDTEKINIDTPQITFHFGNVSDVVDGIISELKGGNQ